MAKKLYKVEVRVETVMIVLAEGEEQALDLAEDHFDEHVQSLDATPELHVTGEVRKGERLPKGWDLACLPFGSDDEDRTIEDILK